MKINALLMTLFLTACAHRDQGRLPLFQALAIGTKPVLSDCLVRGFATLPVAVLREQGGATDIISVRFDQAVRSEVRLTTIATGQVSAAVYEDHGPWQYSQAVSARISTCLQAR
jgi:hypothetical protein